MTHFPSVEELKAYSSDPILNWLLENIKKNTKTHTVSSWETLSSIAHDNWISDTMALLWFNEELCDNKFENKVIKQDKKTWKDYLANVRLNLWKKIYIPQNKADLIEISRIVSKIRQEKMENDRVMQNLIDENKEELEKMVDHIEKNYFPAVRQFIWLWDMLDWFLEAQRLNSDPVLPRTVDDTHKETKNGWKKIVPTCANMLRRLMWLCVNPKFLTPAERAFLAKEQVHAWMLPSELMKIWFVQKFNLMKYVDRGLVWKEEIVPSSRLEDYEKWAIDLWKYLETSWVKWSFVAVYFKLSDYKRAVANYNAWQDAPHLNTHQTMYAWNWEMDFLASDFYDLRKGHNVSTYSQIKQTQSSVKFIEWSITKETSKLSSEKTNLVTELNKESSKLISNADIKLNKVAAQYASEVLTTKDFKDKTVEEVTTYFLELLDKKDYVTLRRKFLRRQKNESLAQKELNDIKSHHNAKSVLKEFTTNFPKYLNSLKNTDKIDLSKIPSSLLSNKKILEKLSEYNETIELILKLYQESEEKKVEVSNLEIKKQEEEQERIRLKEENERLTKEIQQEKPTLDPVRQSILAKLDKLESSEVITKYRANVRLEKFIKAVWKNITPERKIVEDEKGKKKVIVEDQEVFEKRKQQRLESMRVSIETMDPGNMIKAFDKLYTLGEDEITFLTRLQKLKLGLKTLISNLRNQISEKEDPNEISMSKFSIIWNLNSDPALEQISTPLKKEVEEYNQIIKDIKNKQSQIEKNWGRIEVKKDTNILDYVTNFVAIRRDYWSKDKNWNMIFTEPERRKIIEWIWKFHSLIKMEVNWQKIDILAELEKYKNNPKEWMIIKSTDIINFKWPMMVDGYVQKFHPDPDRRENMNARTRFYWEFLVTQDYTVTELLEPGEKSSFRHNDIETYPNWTPVSELDKTVNMLKVKWVFDVRVWEDLNDKIRQAILFYEKKEFDKLDKNDPEYDKKHRKLMKHYFDLQLKALKVAGYTAQVYLNAPIPYFRSENILEVYNKYVKLKNAQLTKKWVDTANYKEYLEVNILEWDVIWTIFGRVASQLEWHNSKSEKFPNLHKLKDFNELQQKMFIKKLFDLVKVQRKVKGSSWSEEKMNSFESIMKWKIIPYDKLILKLDDIDKTIKEVDWISKIWFKFDKELKNIDRELIEELITNSQHRDLIKNILYRESYGGYMRNYTKVLTQQAKDFVKDVISDPVFADKKEELEKLFSKLKISSIWDFQLRISDLKLLGLNTPESKELEKDHWLSKNKILKAIDQVQKNMSIQKRLNDQIWRESYMGENYTAQDLVKVEEIREILTKQTLTNEDYINVYNLLSQVIRVDYTTWEFLDEVSWEKIDINRPANNIVWKVLSISLLEDKIESHFVKLNWWMERLNEPLSVLFENSEYMKSYEKLIMMINNRWEKDILMWLTENYILRVLNSMFDKVETKSVAIDRESEINKLKNKALAGEEWFLNLKTLGQIFKWWIKYDEYIFCDHLIWYVNQYDTNSLTDQQRAFLTKVIKLVIELQNSPKVTDHLFEFINSNKDFDIKSYLTSKNLPTTVLPTPPSEYVWSDFQKTYFGYMNKIVN